MSKPRNYPLDARQAWHRARPWTAMSLLAAVGMNAADRRAVLLSWGVTLDDAIDFSSDTYLSLADFA